MAIRRDGFHHVTITTGRSRARWSSRNELRVPAVLDRLQPHVAALLEGKVAPVPHAAGFVAWATPPVEGVLMVTVAMLDGDARIAVCAFSIVPVPALVGVTLNVMASDTPAIQTAPALVLRRAAACLEKRLFPDSEHTFGLSSLLADYTRCMTWTWLERFNGWTPPKPH